MSMLTVPYYNLAAADRIVMSSGWVPVTNLGSKSGGFSGKRVVLTDSSVGSIGQTAPLVLSLTLASHW